MLNSENYRIQLRVYFKTALTPTLSRKRENASMRMTADRLNHLPQAGEGE